MFHAGTFHRVCDHIIISTVNTAELFSWIRTTSLEYWPRITFVLSILWLPVQAMKLVTTNTAMKAPHVYKMKCNTGH